MPSRRNAAILAWIWAVPFVVLWAYEVMRLAAGSLAAQTDFISYLAAAHALRDHLHAAIYDPRTLLPYDLHHAIASGYSPYVYPPLLALLLIPLTFLPPTAALILWAALNLAAWVVAVVWLLRLIPSPTARLWLLPALLFFLPFWEGMFFGQVDILILLGLLAVLHLVKHGRLGWAGMVLGVLAAVKVVPVLLIVYFVLRRREWRAAWVASLTAGALTIASFALVGWTAFPAYLHALAAWRPPSAALLGLSPLMTAGIAMLVLAWIVAVARYPDGDVRLGYGWALPLLILPSPIAWGHYYVWVLPTFALLMASRPSRAIIVALALCYLPLALVPIPTPLETIALVPLFVVAGWGYLASSERARADARRLAARGAGWGPWAAADRPRPAGTSAAPSRTPASPRTPPPGAPATS